MSDKTLLIDWIDGNCPVQAEGKVDGKNFYFRARGQKWSFGVGAEPVGDPDFYYSEPYGDEPYAAGWMPVHEAMAFIEKAVAIFRERAEQGTVE